MFSRTKGKHETGHGGQYSDRARDLVVSPGRSGQGLFLFIVIVALVPPLVFKLRTDNGHRRSALSRRGRHGSAGLLEAHRDTHLIDF